MAEMQLQQQNAVRLALRAYFEELDVVVSGALQHDVSLPERGGFKRVAS